MRSLLKNIKTQEKEVGDMSCLVVSHMSDRQWCEHLRRSKGEAQAMEIFALMGNKDGTAPDDFKLYALNFGPKNHKTSSRVENKPVFSQIPRWGRTCEGRYAHSG